MGEVHKQKIQEIYSIPFLLLLFLFTDESLLEQTNLTQESTVFKLIVFALTFLLVSSVILVTCYCRGSHASQAADQRKGHDVSPQ